MPPVAGTAVSQIEPRAEVGKNNSAKSRTVGVKQEILLHFIAEPRFQRIEVFSGDVEFNAVSAELDFVDALMETVRKEIRSSTETY